MSLCVKRIDMFCIDSIEEKKRDATSAVNRQKGRRGMEGMKEEERTLLMDKCGLSVEERVLEWKEGMIE